MSKVATCSILYFDLMELSENRDIEFKSGPCIFKIVKLGTISPVHISLTVFTLKSDDSSNHLWYFFWKTLLKVKRRFSRFFKLQTQEEAIEKCPGKQILKPICASIPPVLRLYFIGQKNYFILLFLHEIRIKLISNQFD